MWNGDKAALPGISEHDNAGVKFEWGGNFLNNEELFTA
jgi:hypothetical protein